MAIKLYKKSTVIKNMAIFLLLSVLYLHVISSLNEGISAFDWNRFATFLHNNIALIILAAISALSAIRALPISKFLFAAVSLFVMVEGFYIFFAKFDKIILVLNFVYLVTAFYFFIFWRLEMREAVYCPGYNLNDIGAKSEYQLSATVKLPDGSSFDGLLTNWDKGSCFLYLRDKIKTIPPSVEVILLLENCLFKHTGKIISSFGTGIGIKFDQSTNVTLHGWNQFYNVICDRGYISRSEKG